MVTPANNTTFFTDKLTKIQASWLNDVNQATYGLRALGATGNGSTNDTATLLAILSSVASSGITYLDGGGLSYLISQPLECLVPAGGILRISNANFISSGVPTNSQLLNVSGPGVSQTIGISAVARGQNVITLAAGTLAAGTTIRVSSADLWSDNAYTGLPSVTMGEWATVLSAVGTAITLTAPLRYDYTTTPVVEITGMAAQIELINITGYSDNTGLLHTAAQIQYAIDSRMSAVIGQFCANAGASFDHCYYAYSEDCGNFNPNASLGFAYGVVTGNTCDSAIHIRPRGEGCRHVSAKGGFSGIIARIADYEACGDNQQEGVIDAHTAVDEQWVFGGSTSFSTSVNAKMVSSQARRLRVYGSQAEGVPLGVSWQPSCTAYPSSAVIEGVDFNTTGNGLSIEQRSPQPCESLIISGKIWGGSNNGDGSIVTTNSSYVNVGGTHPPGQYAYVEVDAYVKGTANRGLYLQGGAGKGQTFGDVILRGKYEAGTAGGQYPVNISLDGTSDINTVSIDATMVGGNYSVNLTKVVQCTARVRARGYTTDVFSNSQSGDADALARFDLQAVVPSTGSNNQRRGSAVANGTTAVVVPCIFARTGSLVKLSLVTPGGTVGVAYGPTAVVAGTSFSIKSTNAADTSTYAWEILNPATGP